MDQKDIDKYLEQASTQVQKTLDDADPFRVESYEQLQRVQLTKQQVLTKQKQRLSAKLGAEHPRVKKIDAQINLRTQVIRGVQLERQRAATEQPAIDPKDWIVHGNVHDEAGKAMAGVRIWLGDQSGKVIKPFGEAATDRQGYFRLIVDDIAAVLRKLGAEDPATTKVFVYPQVLDQTGVVLYRSTRALQPNPGQTDFVDIIVGKGGGEIERPPLKPKNPTKPVRILPTVIRQPVKENPVPPKKIKEAPKTTDKSVDVKTKKTTKKKE
jgi:hypothetical protein